MLRQTAVPFVLLGFLLVTATACSAAIAGDPSQAEFTASPSETDLHAPTSETRPVNVTNTRERVHLVDGEKVIDFEVETYAHGTFHLAEFEGQPVVINFWYPSCPGCRIEKPIIKAAEERWRSEGVVFLGAQLIGIDSVADGKKFLEENDLAYRNFADNGPFAPSFGIFGYPSTIVLDPDHTISSKHRGAISHRGTIDSALQEVLGVPVPLN